VIARSTLFVLFVMAVVNISLSSACNTQSAKPPDPETILQTIPSADPAQYDHVQDMQKWRNPYLIVRADGVALLDSADSAELTVKPDDLLAELARLPASRWPYGRVVAAAENAVRASEQDGIAIRRNKGIVGGILQGAKVQVKWVPAG
jgi:hypothetical protein